MKRRPFLLVALLLGSSPSLAINASDPNLSQKTDRLTEGRVLECQSCEVIWASPVDRHAHRNQDVSGKDASRTKRIDQGKPENDGAYRCM